MSLLLQSQTRRQPNRALHSPLNGLPFSFREMRCARGYGPMIGLLVVSTVVEEASVRGQEMKLPCLNREGFLEK